MDVTIGLAQTCHPADGNVVALVDEYAAQAKERGVDLLELESVQVVIRNEE